MIIEDEDGKRQILTSEKLEESDDSPRRSIRQQTKKKVLVVEDEHAY